MNEHNERESMKWYEIKESDIEYKFWRIGFLRMGLPFYKYFIPYLKVIKDDDKLKY